MTQAGRGNENIERVKIVTTSTNVDDGALVNIVDDSMQEERATTQGVRSRKWMCVDIGEVVSITSVTVITTTGDECKLVDANHFSTIWNLEFSTVDPTAAAVFVGGGGGGSVVGGECISIKSVTTFASAVRTGANLGTYTFYFLN